MSWLFLSVGQSIGASASTAILPMHIQSWFPLELTGWAPCSPRDSQESSPELQLESISPSVFSLPYDLTVTSIWLLEKPQLWLYGPLLAKIYHMYTYICTSICAFLVAQRIKNQASMQETQVWSLDQEDPLEKGLASHSSILAWRIPWTEGPDGLQILGSQRLGHDWVTNNFTFFHVYTHTHTRIYILLSFKYSHFSLPQKTFLPSYIFIGLML